jgi:iron-sulfur cluster repair protein YtfE (RIC family)
MVCTVLEAPATGRIECQGCKDTDWRRASIEELCDHIVAVQHASPREALPRIDALLSTVVRVHGPSHHELPRAAEALAALELDLHQHIHEENNVLLPRVRELNARAEPIRDANPRPQ